jgi:flagellar capping protein FliD
LLTAISSHPIVAIVIAALAIILAGVIAIVSTIQNNSPEAKLKKLEEASKAASSAADAAAESYNDLNNSLKNLGDKYDSLKDLTRGTKEWNDAVLGINDSVMDLIDKYPELANFLTSEKGVLTLDLEDAALQEIIIEA